MLADGISLPLKGDFGTSRWAARKLVTSIQTEVIRQRADEVGTERSTRPFPRCREQQCNDLPAASLCWQVDLI